MTVAMFGGVADSYTALWTNDLCRELILGGFAGQRPTVLFGGPHQSRPSFRRAGVRPGDRIFAVRAWQAALHPVCSMEVQQIIDYDRAGMELADEDYAGLIHWRPLKSGCINEVVLGPPGSPLRFDRPLPGEHLQHLTFTSRRGERKLKYVEDGRLLRALSLQGIYRLTPESADVLARHLINEKAAAQPTHPGSCGAYATAPHRKRESSPHASANKTSPTPSES